MPSQPSRHIVVLILISLVALSDSSRISDDKEDGKPKSLFILLAEFLKWTSWFLKSVFYIMYVIINTTLRTTSEIMSTIISIPQKLIDLVELLGYSVRFALQANYNFVSTSFHVLRQLLQNVCVFIKDMAVSMCTLINSLFRMILNFLHKIVFGFPRLFGYAGTGVQTSASVVSALAVKTNTSFRGAFSSLVAVLELFGRSIVTTFQLIADLITYILISCGKFFHLIGRTILSILWSTYRGTVMICQKVGASVKYFAFRTVDYTMHLLVKIKNFLHYLSTSVAMGLLAIFQTIGVMVIKVFLLITTGFKHIIAASRSVYDKTYNRFVHVSLAITETLQGSSFLSSPYMYASASVVLGLGCLFLIQKVNVLNAAFAFMEKLVQGIIMRVVMVTQQEPIIDQEEWSPGNQSVGQSHGDLETLQKQLQRERDKTLCVVCHDNVKKVLLLPCRHMCICAVCANLITSFYQRNRRICPLCRTHINSTVEVYS